MPVSTVEEEEGCWRLTDDLEDGLLPSHPSHLYYQCRLPSPSSSLLLLLCLNLQPLRAGLHSSLHVY